MKQLSLENQSTVECKTINDGLIAIKMINMEYILSNERSLRWMRRKVILSLFNGKKSTNERSMSYLKYLVIM